MTLPRRGIAVRAAGAGARRVVAAVAAAVWLGVFASASPAESAEDGALRSRWRERVEARRGAPPPAPAADGDSALPAGDHVYTLPVDGAPRRWRVHVPAGLDPARPVPLLVALHGGGGSMDWMADDARYGLVGEADRRGVIVVFPNGHSRLASGKLATWNAGRCCGSARDDNADDVTFIRAVVAEVARRRPIDPRRVYATGMSNGGMMAYRLACEASDVFAAIAAVAGTDNTVRCAPSRPVAVLHVHARDDDHVLFDGGAGPAAVSRRAVTDYTSVPQTIARWRELDHCTAPAERTLDTPGAWCERHRGCAGGVELQLCVTATGGHSWPGAALARSGGASQALSANTVMWEFFDRQPR